MEEGKEKGRAKQGDEEQQSSLEHEQIQNNNNKFQNKK